MYVNQLFMILHLFIYEAYFSFIMFNLDFHFKHLNSMHFFMVQTYVERLRLYFEF